MARPPIAMRKYLHPIFPSFTHPSSFAQLIFPSKGHATRLPNNCAKAQATDKTANKY
jgi:hypothetical protein